MELCSGSLRQLIISMKKMKKVHQIYQYFISHEIFRQITEAIKYFHSNNIIDRDLKPENILTTDGSDGIFLKLCDFNLAKALGIEDQIEITNERKQENASIDHTRNTVTMYYKAPEIKTGIYGEKSDIYGLALIVTEIFCFEDNVERISQLLEKSM